MKRILFSIIFGAALLAGCTSVELPGRDTRDYTNGEPEVLTLVDSLATPETKALYSKLWTIRKKGFMFGHHDDLWCGRYWIGLGADVEHLRSDTKEVCGDFPAVLGIDFAELIDDRYNSDPQTNAWKLGSVKQAYDLGMVTVVCLHMDNPLTYNMEGADHNKKGGAWDNNSADSVAVKILTDGSEVQTTYKEWMGRLADILKNLKGSDGVTIPVILRPYHEHNHEWSWWGSSCTTQKRFTDLWQWTVHYLRDTMGVHNAIYAISPQIDSQQSEEAYLTRWPGDNYVDFLGMDCYQGINNSVFSSNLKTLTQISISKQKPCGVTETGVEGFTKATYWTENIHAPISESKVSLVVTWRNKYVGLDENDKHYYSVYDGHPSERDFRTMYRESNSLFCNDLPNMYEMAEGITVK